MAIRFSSRIVLGGHVIKREIDGGSAILNLSTKRSYGLDDVGTRMLQVLSDSPSITRAYEILASEYEVDPEILKRDLLTLIEKLIELKFIELTPSV